MSTQVRIEEIDSSDTTTMLLGVTRIPPAQLTVTTVSTDLKGSVILWYNGVRRKNFHVSFHSQSCEKYCRLV